MESPGQLYVADQRGLLETEAFQRHSFFNNGDYAAPHRQPFGPLTVFNDELLAAGQKQVISIADDCCFILIPVTGAINCNGHSADAGQVFLSYQKAGSNISLKNEYADDWINYIYIQLKVAVSELTPAVFDFELTANVLTNMLAGLETLPFKLHIGLFGGREEALYRVKNDSALLFAYVLTGAFEFQGRLLHERDGLALWNLHEADMEALSNNAVVLVLEM